MKRNREIKALNSKQNKIIMDFQELLSTCEINVGHYISEEDNSVNYTFLANSEDIALRYETKFQRTKRISTLNTNELSSNRGSGNTTRQVDFAIQKLFEGYEVIVKDHYNHKLGHNELLRKIKFRLEMEHPRIKFLTKKDNDDIIIKIHNS